MDFLNYRLTWAQQEEGDKLPAVRILAAAYQWDMEDGRHPIFSKADGTFFERDPFADTQKPDVSLEFQIRPMGCVHGHNTMADQTYTSLINVDVNIPISPLFVRDLCGRTIYIGYGPEEKLLEEWDAYQPHKKGAEGNLLNPHIPNITFPQNCRAVEENSENADLLESVFMLKWRTLDVALDFNSKPSGREDLDAAGVYGNPNLYPYKLRLDTFYTDGYKLPQTNMVYARKAENPQKAIQEGEVLREKWAHRPEGQDYETWYEEQDGEAWFEAMYQKGCTVISKVDGCNGFHVVGTQFQLKDYWPGRFVPGLHIPVEEREHAAPAGTILDVIEPGYVTATQVVPARVVISNGRGYVSAHTQDPAPMLPNLHLPHQRTVAEWGSTWVPTHPSHFEPPALWGWDAQTGRFLQLWGPLWDPLHYYYDCMDPILQAYKQPMPENRWLVPVPEKMQARFHPVVPMVGFDVTSEEAFYRRIDRNTIPRSALTRMRDGEPGATLGYHPLPMQFEYEIDTWWFPNLHPLNRTQGTVPEEVIPQLCPVIKSEVGVKRYAEAVNGPKESTWLFDKDVMQQALGEPLEDYPFLLRYVAPDLEMEGIMHFSQGLFLEHVPQEFLEASTQERWAGIDDLDALDELADGFYDAVYDMREESIKLLRLRHEIYQKNPAMYAYAWWFCLTPQQLEQHFREWEKQKEDEAPEDRKPRPLQKMRPEHLQGQAPRKV